MSPPDDPYVYPGTTVLRNTLNLRDAEQLSLAEDRRAGVRYAALLDELPKPPFTFETLKDIHRALFQDVYRWAGEPRTIALGKPEFDDPRSRVTWFTQPGRIEAEGTAIFDRLAQANFLTGLERPQFALAAAEFLRDVNGLHAFREGNGRSQRLMLASIGENASNPMAFDVVTRERMVATSIDASHGDASGLARLMDDVTDPRRNTALRTALDALRQHGAGSWNDLYIATAQAGQTYDGVLVGRAGPHFMMRVDEPARSWVAIGGADDLPATAKDGQPITVVATQFTATLTHTPAADKALTAAPPARGVVLDTLLATMRPRTNTTTPPWEPNSTPMTERFRATEERVAQAKDKSAPKPEQRPKTEPAPEPGPSKPRSGPRPG